MLSQLRQFTKGWVATGFVVLIGLAFAIWGMPNMFNAAARPLVTVNGQAIGRAEIQRAFSQILEAQQAQGRTFTQAQAIQAGAHRQAIEGLVFQTAVFGFSRRLGLDASDAQVAEVIRGYPGFQDAYDMDGEGGFDRNAYQSAIAAEGYTVPEFEDMQRQLLASSQLLDALAVGARAPSSFGAFALAFESERRTLAAAEITPARIGAIPAPSEQELTAFFEENGRQWQLPETRTFTIVIADPAAFAERVVVTDEQIDREFQRRSAQLTVPERRSLTQIVFRDEAAAQAAARRLSAGEDAEALAQELGGQLFSHVEIDKSGLPDSAVADVAFSINAGPPAQAVRGSLAPWSVIRVDAVIAAQEADRASAAEAIRGEIVQNEARRLMQDAMTSFDQQRRRRTPFAQAAQDVGFRVERAANVAANGFTLAGEPGLTIADPMPVLQAAFTQRQGRPTDWMRLRDGTEAIVQIEAVEAARTPPLEQVREDVVEAWRINERDKRMKALAQEVADAVAGGETFAAAIASRSLRSAGAPAAVMRPDAYQALGRALAPQAFGAAEGAVVFGYRLAETPQGVVPMSDALVLVHVVDVERADPSQSTAEVQALRQREDQAYWLPPSPPGQQPRPQGLQQALSLSLGDAIRGAARVRENPAAIESMFPTGEEDQSGS